MNYVCNYCGLAYDLLESSACTACGAVAVLSKEQAAELKAAKKNKNQKNNVIIVNNNAFAHPKKRFGAVRTTLIVLGVIFFVILVFSAAEVVKERSGLNYDYTRYTETGHKDGEKYSGAIEVGEGDLSEYGKISWSETPYLQWGETWSYNDSGKEEYILYIVGKIRNDSAKDIESVYINFDILDKNGKKIETLYASADKIPAGQTGIINSGVDLYKKDGFTYSDVSSITLSEARITYYKT